jgi:hypothetical protein
MTITILPLPRLQLSVPAVPCTLVHLHLLFAWPLDPAVYIDVLLCA